MSKKPTVLMILDGYGSMTTAITMLCVRVKPPLWTS